MIKWILFIHMGDVWMCKNYPPGREEGEFGKRFSHVVRSRLNQTHKHVAQIDFVLGIPGEGFQKGFLL
jgi:hypothetical protein